MFAERLNNAQRDSKMERMSVHLLLANFLCDLLHSTVPVTASCDTCTHTSPLRILNTMVTSTQVLHHGWIFCVLNLKIKCFIVFVYIDNGKHQNIGIGVRTGKENNKQHYPDYKV